MDEGKEKQLSVVDELIQALQKKAISNVQSNLNPMEQMMQLMMLMAMPKAIKSMGEDDGGSSKIDLIIKQLQESQKNTEERLLREIEALKSEKKEKELIDKIDQKIEPLKNLITEMNKEKEKQPDETTKNILEKIEMLQDQLKNLDESQKAKAYKPIEDELSTLKMKLEELSLSRSRGDSLDELLEQMERIEKTKMRLAKMLGITPKEAEEMSPGQLIDTITKKAPELVTSVKTMYDVWKGNETTDETPIPANVPETPAPVSQPSMPKIDPDLEQFLSEGHEEFIDPGDPSKGKVWVSRYGIPVQSPTGEYFNADDMRMFALTNPDGLRDIAKQIEEAWKEQQKQSTVPPPPPPTSQPTEIPKNVNVTTTPEKPQESIQEPQEPEQEPLEPKEKPPEPKKIEITPEMIEAAENPAKPSE